MAFMLPILIEESKYPPAQPEALELVAPQRGVCRSAPCRSPPVARAVGVRRGELAPRFSVGFAQRTIHLESRRDGAHAPRPSIVSCKKKVKTQTRSDFRKCQTFYCHPGKAGGSPVWNRKATSPTQHMSH